MKVTRSEGLSLLKKIFLVDLIKGLMLTFSYQRPSASYTEQYPKVRPKVAQRYRGAPRLNNDPETRAESTVDNFRPLFSSECTPLAGILAMVAVAPWLYVGFDTLPQAAEELSFSHKQTRRLMVVSILAGAAMYVTVLLCTAAVGPWQELVGEGSPWLTGATVRRTLGPIGLTILGLAVGAQEHCGFQVLRVRKGWPVSQVAGGRRSGERYGVVGGGGRCGHWRPARTRAVIPWDSRQRR